MAARRFVLLDRDGTLNVECHYLADPEQVELLPGVPEGLRVLRGLGLGLIVGTNQSGIGRGYFDEERLLRVHERLRSLLRAEGVELDAIYVCPHHPEAGCPCRKPRTGLIERAAGDFKFDPGDCFVIGDKPCDIEMGDRAGAVALLVRTGYGTACEQDVNRVARSGDDRRHFVVDDLVEAAAVIRRQLTQGEPRRRGQYESSEIGKESHEHAG